MPPPTKGVGFIRIPDTGTDAAISGHNLEDDVECCEGYGIRLEVV